MQPPATSDCPAARRFGTGWISGTLSVTLGVVGLLAVLCFHFPSYLTMPQVRAYYPLVWVRLLLHVILVSAFLLGCLSFVLRHNKTLGVIGMALAVVAAALGGSRVQIEGNLTGDYYLGLDYVLLLFVLYSLIFSSSIGFTACSTSSRGCGGSMPSTTPRKSSIGCRAIASTSSMPP
jgi:hypothetical protein